MAIVLLLFLILALPLYWLAWYVLLFQAFTFVSWPALGLAISLYAINRMLMVIVKKLSEELK